MAELNEHVAYLSQEIGPRPAGTEEEQRAALYISEQFSAEAGLTTLWKISSAIPTARFLERCAVV